MKSWSIKFKITLWYTVFMTLLILVVLWLLFSIGSSRLLIDARQRLQNVVMGAYDEIEYENGALVFDDDIKDLGEGVYLSVYSPAGAFLYGKVPAFFDASSPLIMDSIRESGEGSYIWHVYDYCQYVEGYGNLWIRGISSRSNSDSALRTILRLALISLPFFVLCIALGGYSIIRKALLPLSEMTATAARISGGKNLTERIIIDSGKDEVHKLGYTFNCMMDRLQTSFENEKQFTSDVSHELRTPISVILSQCEYAAAEDTADEERRKCLAVIMEQSKKMSALVSQLLTLARADNGRQKLGSELLNLSELTEIIVQEQQTIAARKGISLVTDIQPDVLMCGDETMMMRLLINLISNSITYGKENGRTDIALSAEEHAVTCCITDNGIGIPADKLDKIWQRFYQIEPSRSAARGTGAGLGLSMAKWIVQAHGGTITAESRLGEGSRFTFHIPMTENFSKK